MKSVQEFHAAAVAMQREGLPPHETARRLVELANDQGYNSIIHRSSPPVIELIFEGEGRMVRFDGEKWRYDAGSRSSTAVSPATS